MRIINYLLETVLRQGKYVVRVGVIKVTAISFASTRSYERYTFFRITDDSLLLFHGFLMTFVWKFLRMSIVNCTSTLSAS